MAESKYGKYIITELKQGARTEVHATREGTDGQGPALPLRRVSIARVAGPSAQSRSFLPMLMRASVS